MRASLRLLLLVCCLASAAASGATLRVPQHFATIQSAVDAAHPGDTVIVGPGTYVENVVIQKSLRVRSSHGAAATTIDANFRSSPVTIVGTGVERVSLSGFRLIHGRYEFEFPPIPVGLLGREGPGVNIGFVEDAEISDNIVELNETCNGSLRSQSSNVTIRDNVVRDNPSLWICAGSNAGIVVSGSEEMTARAVIERNRIYDHAGRGLIVSSFRHVTIRGNDLRGNGKTAQLNDVGGGLSVEAASGVVSGNTLIDNYSTTDGAGMLFTQPPVFAPQSLVVTGNYLAGNDGLSDFGGAVTIYSFRPSSVLFAGNTVVGHTPAPLVHCGGEYGDGWFVAGNLLHNTQGAELSPTCGH
jgi:hypothetical protein